MLDVSVRLDGVELTFPRSTHTAITGPPACGSSTLLRVIAGEERAGSVKIGTRDVSKVPRDRRPLLYVTGDIDVPGRWSVEHALVNAVRGRTLDREDRHHELQLAVEKWQLDVNRRVGTLSDSERTRVHLARIELRKPAIVVADKLLRDAPQLADEFFRTLRVLGTTVISAPSSLAELGLTDRVVILDHGRVVQEGTAAQIFAEPKTEAAAVATGAVNTVPVIVKGRLVSSPIGEWEADAPFQGEGKALIRPDAFHIAKPGEESDLIFGIEEATFENGVWIARGFLTGVLSLRVALPRSEKVHKGRVIALRFDPSGITLASG
ncbi:MAG TPA: ATP-binding cassette domain-containing protein [Thermoanaerobaculia bacterium]|nr:ATP-binding cassette domain-containing protein [Thermoanaerobaculia bacterium]